MQSIKPFQDLINQQLSGLYFPESPRDLYEPIRYFLGIGGKRIRPILTLMANDMFGGQQQDALSAALAIEVFHNFTLMHDDLMDQAPLRRGQSTVHQRWNANIAILSGDTMLIKAYDLLSKAPVENLAILIQIFNQTAMDVCRGQQYDMEFENRNDVSLAEYMEMIRLKTAVLLGASLKVGALIGGASPDDADKIYRFGEYIGIAFQLQDDYLDAFGNKDQFGKQIGGDILADKKTFLMLTALQNADENGRNKLAFWMNTETSEKEDKVSDVLALYKKWDVDKQAIAAVQAYSERAFEQLEGIQADEEKKAPLRELTHQLIKRLH